MTASDSRLSGETSAQIRPGGRVSDERYDVHVRPRRSLLVTAFFSMLLAMVPLFGALYFFTWGQGTWPVVLGLQLLITAACAGLTARQLTVFCAVTRTQLIGRGIFSPLERVDLADIEQVLLVETYTGYSVDSVTQLLVRGRDGRRLFRMRGNYWNPGALQQVADALPVEACVVSDPISMSTMFAEYPGSAYWFENNPRLRIATIAGGIAVAIAGAVIVMGLLGVPLSPGL